MIRCLCLKVDGFQMVSFLFFSFSAGVLLMGYETHDWYEMNQGEINFEASCLHHLKVLNSHQLVGALPA